MASLGSIGNYRRPAHVRVLDIWAASHAAATPIGRIGMSFVRKQNVWIYNDRTGVLFRNGGKIAGVVKESGVGVPNAVVRIYYRPSGVFVAGARTASDGTFEVSGFDQDDVGKNFSAIAFDPAGGTQYNAVIFDYLNPQSIAPLSASGNAPDGYVATPYSYTYAAIDYQASVTWDISAGALPVGLTLAASGTITGSATTTGSSSWTARVTDGNGNQATVSDSMSVTIGTLTLTGTLPSGQNGVAYSASLVIAGGNGAYSNPQVASGSLPPGLAISIVGSSLVVSGTPSTSGTYAFTLSVDSGDGQTATSSAQSISTATYSGFNPSDKGASSVLSGSNFVVGNSATANSWARTVASKTSGKFRVQLLLQTFTAESGGGIATSGSVGTYAGSTIAASALWGNYSGILRLYNSGIVATYSGSVTHGGRLDIIVDIGAGKLWFAVDGTLVAGNPAAGTGASLTFTPGTATYIIADPYTNGSVMKLLKPSEMTGSSISGFTDGWPD